MAVELPTAFMHAGAISAMPGVREDQSMLSLCDPN
jgi:hypothetical protein